LEELQLKLKKDRKLLSFDCGRENLSELGINYMRAGIEFNSYLFLLVVKERYLKR